MTENWCSEYQDLKNKRVHNKGGGEIFFSELLKTSKDTNTHKPNMHISIQINLPCATFIRVTRGARQSYNCITIGGRDARDSFAESVPSSTYTDQSNQQLIMLWRKYILMISSASSC